MAVQAQSKGATEQSFGSSGCTQDLGGGGRCQEQSPAERPVGWWRCTQEENYGKGNSAIAAGTLIFADPGLDATGADMK